MFRAFIRGLKAGFLQWSFVIERIKRDGRRFWFLKYNFTNCWESIGVGRGDYKSGNGSRKREFELNGDIRSDLIVGEVKVGSGGCRRRGIICVVGGGFRNDGVEFIIWCIDWRFNYGC